MATDIIAEMLADAPWRIQVEDRFWPKVIRLSDAQACWEWTAAKCGPGRNRYGAFTLKHRHVAKAHRLSYALASGRSPGRMLVCHLCDNPTCVRPSHLFLGTPQDNTSDMIAKGRCGKQDNRGTRNPAAKLSVEQVVAIREKIGDGLTNVSIAALYDVTPQLISAIRLGRRWASVPTSG